MTLLGRCVFAGYGIFFPVQALVSRMALLPRLKYILDVVRPQAPTVIHILQILVRVARHSAKLAYQVCPVIPLNNRAQLFKASLA